MANVTYVNGQIAYASDLNNWSQLNGDSNTFVHPIFIPSASPGTSGAINISQADSRYAPTSGSAQYATITGSTNYAVDTGTANTYAIALIPAPAALTPGMTVGIDAIVASNTGASTLNVNGLGALPIQSAGGVALQGGELVATYGAVLRLNHGGTAWILLQTTGGSLPVKAATQTEHAVNLGQAQSDFAAIAGSATQNFNAAQAAIASEVTIFGQVFGLGQAINSGGLALSTIYTNTGTKPIAVYAVTAYASSHTVNGYIQGNLVVSNGTPSGGAGVTLLVLPGESYEITDSIAGATITSFIQQ